MLRRALRALLLRLAAWLEVREEAGALPVMMSSGGPPAHWVAKVRKAAPQLLPSTPSTPAATVPSAPRVVPRVGVPRGSDVQKARAAMVEAQGGRRRVMTDAATPDAPVALLPASGEKVPEGRMRGVSVAPFAAPAAPLHPALRATLSPRAGRGVTTDVANIVTNQHAMTHGVPSTINAPKWPELLWTAATPVAALPSEGFAPNQWPELPVQRDDTNVVSLEDHEHRRRISREQRGEAWSE